MMDVKSKALIPENFMSRSMLVAISAWKTGSPVKPSTASARSGDAACHLRALVLTRLTHSIVL